MKNRILLPIVLIAITLACSDNETNNTKQTYIAPEWTKGIVWYQIFPERFANGDFGNEPTADRLEMEVKNWKIKPWTSQWYGREQWEKDFHKEFGWSVTRRRYGGDLQGVIDRLDYLQSLGVGGIYFNPIFDAVSHHKYDASSYHHIDRFFGPDPEGDVKIMRNEDPSNPDTWQWTSADSLFLKLLQEAKKRNIRIVIDGVFNHTGRDFWAFRDLKENQDQSKVKDWYDVISFDNPDTEENEFDYEGWWGYKSLPVFAEKDSNLVEPVKNHIFAITQRWMDPNGDGDPTDGIDGWRLDVAEEIGMNFWYDWHQHVRSLNPEAITIAEVWDDNAEHLVHQGLFTAVMNYRFLRPLDDFFVTGKKTKSEFEKEMIRVLNSFPENGRYSQQNLLESHDTERFASRPMNPDRSFKENSKTNDGFNFRKPTEESRQIQRVATAFQMLWPGSPMVYYGTEVGMWGADDPDDRKPMVWPDFQYEAETLGPDGKSHAPDDIEVDLKLLSFYKQLIALRNDSEVIKQGTNQFLETQNEDVIAFERSFEGKRLVMVFNRSKKTLRIDLPNVDLKKKVLGQGEVREGVILIDRYGWLVLRR